MPGDRGANIAGREVNPEEPREKPMPSEASLKALRRRGAEGGREQENEADDQDSDVTRPE